MINLHIFALYQALTLLASISPLLTFANLWQVKEWRFDRLREHVRREGVFRQLFGIIRPAVVLILLIPAVLQLLPNGMWPLLPLIALAALSVVQIALGRQPMPVWTKKAIVQVLLTLLLTSLYLAVLLRPPTLFWVAFLPLLQPFLLAMSWAIFKPLDVFLKQRILSRAAALRESLPDLTVIGVTGSVGKTTTKALLAHLFTNENALVTPAHVNTELGVAQWFLKNVDRKNPPRVLVAEMGAYRRGEIALLCKVLKPQVGVVTFVGRQHIGLFGSQEALRNAKGELVDALPKDGCAFLNGDNGLCASLAEKAACPVVTVGTGSHTDLVAHEIEEIPEGIRFRLDDQPYNVPLHGTHNVTNILLAIAVARELGMSKNVIINRLRSFKSPDQTFAVETRHGVTILNDTHNASVESFTAAINWAKEQPVENRILLTSGLIELGEEQDRAHTELGTLSASVFGRAIFTNKRSATAFGRGYGRQAEILSKTTAPIPRGSLLVCEGRVPQSAIERLIAPQLS